MSLCRALKKRGHLVSNKTSFVVGDGKRIKFWRDLWYGYTPLCVDFPSLCVFARAKEAWVGDVWSLEQGRGCGNPTCIRLFNDWGMDDVERLLFHLRSKKVIEGVDDKVKWEGVHNGVFSVKSLYKILEQRSSISFPWKCIWSSVQPKICFFCMGICLEQDLNARAIEEKRVVLCKQMFSLLRERGDR